MATRGRTRAARRRCRWLCEADGREAPIARLRPAASQAQRLHLHRTTPRRSRRARRTAERQAHRSAHRHRCGTTLAPRGARRRAQCAQCALASTSAVSARPRPALANTPLVRQAGAATPREMLVPLAGKLGIGVGGRVVGRRFSACVSRRELAQFARAGRARDVGRRPKQARSPRRCGRESAGFSCRPSRAAGRLDARLGSPPGPSWLPRQ